MWDGGKLVWHTGIAASGVVFFLGILDRFSIYLIPLKIRQPEFISTLGNINWFSGYLSVLAPIGICLFLFHKKNSLLRFFYGVYTVIAFMAGLCQGGDSIFLFFGALFYILLWIAIKKEEWFRDYFLLLFLWGVSAQAVRLMRFLIPEGYNYDTNNLCAHITDSNVTLLAGILAFAVFYVLWKKQGKIIFDKRLQSLIQKGMAGLLLGGVLIWLFVAALNTKIGISGLEEKSFLLLNENWGNGRGAAFSCAVNCFKKMPVMHKLLGAGPDCFSVYAYSLPEEAVKLRAAFGESRLTNAHNELLTCLVNEGISGVCFFLGIIICFVIICMKKGNKNTIFYVLAVSTVCYFFHNMVSFEQVLNISYLFLFMGMGGKSRSLEQND